VQEAIQRGNEKEVELKRVLEEQAQVDDDISYLRTELGKFGEDQRNHEEQRLREEVDRLRDTLAELRKDKGRLHSTKENIEKARIMEMLVLCERQLKAREDEVIY
jgi:hypothetical protein